MKPTITYVLVGIGLLSFGVLLCIFVFLPTQLGGPQSGRQTATPTLMPTVIPTPSPTVTPTPVVKQYAGLVRVERPPEVINGMPIPAFSNVVAEYSQPTGPYKTVDNDLPPNTLKLSVECPLDWYLRTHGLYTPLVNGECGVILNASLDGKDLALVYWGNWGGGNLAAYALPDNKRPTETKLLTADIWLLPNMVYQATWKLDPKEKYPIGPLEFTTSLRELSDLTGPSVSRDFELTEKTGVGLLPISMKLHPYLTSLWVEQIGKEITYQNLKIRDDGWMFSVKGLEPGYYIIRAFYNFPDITQGGNTRLVVSPMTEHPLHVVRK